MKRELTLTDIAGYLPYGLNIYDRKRGITTVWNWQSADCSDWNGEDKVETISGEQYSEELVLATPVLRPMSDIYKEITDKDYNDGKPFIPSDHLKELLDGDFEDCLILDCRIKYSPSEFWYSDMSAILDMFHQLKFDYRGLIDAGLAISVHDLKQNPYEK